MMLTALGERGLRFRELVGVVTGTSGRSLQVGSCDYWTAHKIAPGWMSVAALMGISRSREASRFGLCLFSYVGPSPDVSTLRFMLRRCSRGGLFESPEFTAQGDVDPDASASSAVFFHGDSVVADIDDRVGVMADCSRLPQLAGLVHLGGCEDDGSTVEGEVL
jgi:hypothetical protein